MNGFRRVRARGEALWAWGEGLWNKLLARPRAADIHRAYQRYYDTGMHYLAGSVTYAAVLALFPFIGLLYAVAARVAARDPQLGGQINRTLTDSLGVPVDVGSSVYSAEAAASFHAVLGTLGVTGVIYACHLWTETYRQALHRVWGADAEVSAVRRYGRQVVTPVLLILALTVLMVLAAFATGGPYRLMKADGHGWPLWAVIAARLAALAIAVAWASFGYLMAFYHVGGAPRVHRVREAALLGGTCLTVLLIVGLLLIRHAFADPVYGIVVATLGLMIWTSATARLTLSLAVWAG